MYQRKSANYGNSNNNNKRRALFYFGRRGLYGNVDTTSTKSSLYVALVFGAFFAVMLIIQMMSVEDANNRYSSFYVDDEEADQESKSEGILGRFRLLGEKSNDGEKEMILPPQVARELERILSESKYNAEVFSSVNAAAQSGHLRPQPDSGNTSNPFNTNDHWQRVTGTKDKFFVFSAYYDDRNPRTRYVRVIAATTTRKPDSVQCKLWYNSRHSPLVVRAVNKLIRENWNLKYSAYFVLCLVGNHPIPDQISVVIKKWVNSTSTQSDRKAEMSNILQVLNQPNSRLKPKILRHTNDTQFAVCVKPLHYEYNKVIKLIEFIEMNRLLGVSHFILYNHTIGPEVDCLLRSYIKRGVVSILQWQLNITSQKEIRTEGLFAALNDCLYRTMYQYKYVLMIDLDEYIVPHLDSNYHQLLTKLNFVGNNDLRAGAYSFQNGFFYLQWPDDLNSTTDSGYDLSTLRKTRRKEKLHIHKQRSKLIVLPERVVEVGNHFVWEFVPRYQMVNVPPKVAYLHHYRICEYGGDECINTASVVDKRAHFWSINLIESVDKIYKQFTNSCKL